MIAVVSDLHAMDSKRLDQLDRDINHFSPDEIWCLGDLVGYGNHPKESVSWARDRCDIVVSGNHDAAVSGQLPGFRRGLPYWLRHTLDLAEKTLGAEELDWLYNLPRRAEKYETKLVHGSGPDPWMGFISEKSDIEKTVEDRKIALVGHTHCPGAWALGPKGAKREVADHGTSIDLDRAGLVLNPGTAGLRQTAHNCPCLDRRPGWMLYQPDGFAAWRRFGPSV